MLSLVCCKGGGVRENGAPINSGMRLRIGRDHREPVDRGEHEVWVAALYGGKLLYAAKLTKIISMWRYFSEYQDRLDSIYTACGDGPASPDDAIGEGSLIRNGVSKGFHRDEKRQLRDRLGRYALLSTQFVYWGDSPAGIYDEAFISAFPKNRGFTRVDQSSEHFAAVQRFFRELDWSQPSAKAPHRWIERDCQECFQM